jgi:hypothetical protein
MPQEFIFVKGAREHNLKNISVTIPRDRLVVINPKPPHLDGTMARPHPPSAGSTRSTVPGDGEEFAAVLTIQMFRDASRKGCWGVGTKQCRYQTEGSMP